jgi:LPXTG-motif cell wall-anchored protein
VNRFKLVAIVFCLALVAVAFAPNTKAQSNSERTVVTFTEPVELPGNVILPAGTYVFKLVDSGPNRYIVQVLNEREDHPIATFLTIKNLRMHETSKNTMTFKERAGGAPPALKVWWAPGEINGREFVYPKNRAVELAKQTQEPVLAMPADLAPAIVAPVAAPTDPPVVALEQAPVTVIQPTGDEVPVTQAVVDTPTPAPVVAPVVAPEVAPAAELPATASSMPLIGLIGLLSISAAFGLWFLKKRSVA